MSTATGMAFEMPEPGEKASPDWIASRSDQRNHKSNGAAAQSADVVELKYRSLENLGSSKLAKGLGYFSIALGLAEIVAPRAVGSLMGVNGRYKKALPLLGAREIAHGIGIMKSVRPSTAMWTRVGGDALDLAFLGAAGREPEANKGRLAASAAAILGITLLDIYCAQKLSSNEWSEADGNPTAPTTLGQPSARAGAQITGGAA